MEASEAGLILGGIEQVVVWYMSGKLCPMEISSILYLSPCPSFNPQIVMMTPFEQLGIGLLDLIFTMQTVTGI
jgi:hypothetical protein